jgi:hypothetical protein
MKKATFLTIIAASLILSTSYTTIGSPKSGFDGVQQDKVVKKAKTAALTTGGTRSGGNGQGGSQQDTTVVKPPVRGGKHLDSLRHIKKMRH